MPWSWVISDFLEKENGLAALVLGYFALKFGLVQFIFRTKFYLGLGVIFMYLRSEKCPGLALGLKLFYTKVCPGLIPGPALGHCHPR